MTRKRKKPTAATTEPDIDVEPITPIEPELEYVEPTSPPTTYEPPPLTLTDIKPQPTFKDKYGKYVPSRKWGASTVGALGTVLIMWATTGTWDQEETVASITLGVTAISAYLLPNASGNPNEQDFT